MEHRELSLISKLDNGLTKGLCIMLGWLKYLGLWLLGLVMLVASFLMIFEYGEGLADISWHEWGFLLLLSLLLWRHVSYCQYFSIGLWNGLSRLLIAQGVLGVLSYFIIGSLLSLVMASEHLDSFLFSLAQENPIEKLVEYGLILLAVYLAAPVSKKSPSVKQAVPAQVEPDIPTVTDEIVQ